MAGAVRSLLVLGVVLMVVVTVIRRDRPHLAPLPHCDPFRRRSSDREFHDYDDRTGTSSTTTAGYPPELGTTDLPNRLITAAFYCDGVRVRCNLESFHGTDVPGGAIHTGFEKMGGEGCSGETWEVGTVVLIDFNNGSFLPGQTVRVDIIDTGTGCVISRDIFHRSAVPEQ
jgi:hypothetical protein